MRTLITGATGLLGKKLLAKLDNAVVLTRDAGRVHAERGQVEVHRWEPEAGPAPLESVRDVDVVFNLAGEPVAGSRWTKEKKRRIADSRIKGTRNLIATLGALERRPRVLVSASAVGYYGEGGDAELSEDAPRGRGFLAEVCSGWEREAMAASRLGIRVVCMRIGIVLAPGGGAMGRMLGPFRMGAGGTLGSGKQWMPWIHIDDAIGLLLHASRDETLTGAVNAVSPNPVTNADFTRALGKAVHRPAFLPVPKVALQIAFGEMSEVILASQRVVPRAAERSGYKFEYTHLHDALATVVAAG